MSAQEKRLYIIKTLGLFIWSEPAWFRGLVSFVFKLFKSVKTKETS